MSTGTTAHHAEVTVTEDGKLSLGNLPVRAGERVEVIVIPLERTPPALAGEIRARLSGSVLKDEDPFVPATSPEDGEAGR